MNSINDTKVYKALFLAFNACFTYNEYVKKIMDEDTDAGDRFLKLIDSIQIDPMYSTIKAGTHIYRARCVDPSQLSSEKGIHISEKLWTNGFDDKNSRECPLGMSTSGRNNIAGMSYLYAAENVATACAEVKPHIKQLISVAEFIVQEDLSIVDFSNDCAIKGIICDECQMSAAIFMTNVMSCFTTPVTDIESYKISQLVADHIRKNGFAGIAYRSFHTGDRNYTIFHSHPSKIKYISSRLLIKQVKEIYWDFNNESNIIAQHENSIVTSENSYLHLEEIRKALNRNKRIL